MNQELYKYMTKIGLKSTSRGFKYINELVERQLFGQNILPLKTCGYVFLANKYESNVVNIDKNIQNAISKAWLFGDIETLYGEFGNTIDISKGKPTVKQLLMHICEHMRLFVVK